MALKSFFVKMGCFSFCGSEVTDEFVYMLGLMIPQLEGKSVGPDKQKIEDYANALFVLTLRGNLSMECNSMVSIAALGPRDSDSNPGWFADSKSNQKLSFHE